MATSTVDTALSGLRLAGAKPRAVAVWSAFVLVLGFATNLITALVMGREFTRFTAPGGPPAGLDWGRLGAGYLLILVLALACAAVICTAVYRAVLKADDGRAAYLRLGSDELRMAGLTAGLLGIYLLAMLVVWLVIVVIAIVVTVAAGVAGASPTGSLSPVLIGVILAVIAIPLLFALFAWLGVRLSLAGPMTLDTRRNHIAAAWRLTRGNFWRLFRAFALSWLLLAVVWMVSTALAAMAAATFGGLGALADVMGLGGKGQAFTVEAVLSPARLAYLVGASLLSGLFYAVALAPAAVAYRDLRPSADVSETFS